jgi:hypothetical protein
MPLWKLNPADSSNRNWAASTHVGLVIVRADDETTARRLAARAFGIATRHRVGEEIKIVPWDYRNLVTAERAEACGDYDEDGEAAIVGPSEAVNSAHPGYNQT